MSSNKLKIDKILSKTATVEVLGEEFELSMPTGEQIQELRSMQFAAAQYSDDDLHGVEGLTHLSSYTTKCVHYTLQVDESDAASIIFASGGEAGQFFKSVQEFLGLTPIAEDGTVDNPL